MMKLLKAPANVLSASVGGVSIAVIDGCCEVDDVNVPALLAHGFTVIAAGGAHDPRPPAEGNEMSQADVTIALLGRAERPELFAIAKSMGVALTATMKTEAMREALIEETRKKFEGAKPVNPAAGDSTQKNSDGAPGSGGAAGLDVTKAA